jgi:membrane fusion protein, multidrug efflux system
MSEQGRQSSELGDAPTSTSNADPAPSPQNPPGGATVPPEKPKPNPRRKMLLGALGVLVLAGALWFGVPWVQTTLNTVSTDDAYVNGHVTFSPVSRARFRGFWWTTTTGCAKATF